MSIKRQIRSRRSKIAMSVLVFACAMSAAAEAGPRNGAPIVYKGDTAANTQTPTRYAQAPAMATADRASARIDFRYPDSAAPVQTASAPAERVAPAVREAARVEAPQFVVPPNRPVVESAALEPMPAAVGQGASVLAPAAMAGQPAADADFSETGTALIYGEEFVGLPTANGEMFSQTEMTAAHPSLPLPSLVHVTNLDTGREVVVRVNDRGPFEDNANLQVSQQAAKALGFNGAGKGNVRLRYLGPAPVIAANGAAVTPPSSSQVQPVVQPAPVQVAAAPARQEIIWPVAAEDHELMGGNEKTAQPTRLMSLKVEAPRSPVSMQASLTGDHYVQLASFSELGNAEAMLRRVEGALPVEIVPARVNGADFFRVRVGPFDSRGSAEQIRERLHANGTADGRVVTGS